MLVKACLNGAGSPAEHPRLPVTPAELAADARAVVAAGAGAVHLHPRDADGLETLESEAVGTALTAVRSACPGTPVGVSTGLWITGGDSERRLALVRRWRGSAHPDFASVNLAEPDAAPLTRVLLAGGIGVEAGLASVSDAERLADSGLAADLLRVLIEPADDDPDAAVASASLIDAAVAAGDIAAPRLHHGYGQATWAVVRAAIAAGRDVRVGLEDTLVLPDGRAAIDNRELVSEAIALAEA